MSGSGKILVEVPDVPEAAMWIYEQCIAKVDGYKPPNSIFFPGLDENMHDAVECWIAGIIISDNPALSANGNEFEVNLARQRRDEAFAVMEKIQSITRHRS